MSAKKKITVRRATRPDTDGIIEVLRSTKLGVETWSGDEKWLKKALDDFLDLENYTLIVAECDHEVIGFIDYCTFPSFWEGSKQGIINHLFVTSDFQDEGVGAMLLEAVIEEADGEGLDELHVSTERENVKARRLYVKYGFTEERLLLEHTRK